MGPFNWNIFKVRAGLGYSTGTSLYPIIRKIFVNLPAKDKPSVGPGMQLGLANHKDNTTLVYPVKVINVKDLFIGTARNADEYVQIWNSNNDNLEVGSVLSGVGMLFDVAPRYLNSGMILYAENV